jgi:biofilm PGA synthesis N-glycosyltransferase PgaC
VQPLRVGPTWRPVVQLTADQFSAGDTEPPVDPGTHGLDLSGLNRPGPRIVSLIPAHNEQDGIVKTVRSQFAQTIEPALVIVMADNCTDDTVRLAREAGAQVVETVGNKAKKAGALNQGLALVMPLLDDGDYILAQDADGELSNDFVKNALWAYDVKPNLGGVSGCIIARTPNNFIERAQAIEYARGTRLMGRQGGKVHVLSGAASLFPVHVFRAIADARGKTLPGAPGSVYMEDSLTEDYELTLAGTSACAGTEARWSRCGSTAGTRSPAAPGAGSHSRSSRPCSSRPRCSRWS